MSRTDRGAYSVPPDPLVGVRRLAAAPNYPSIFGASGLSITDDAECTKDIRGRLAKGLGIGAKLKKIWQNHGIRISTKIRLMKALVWSVAMYGCESWTLKKDDEKRISAFLD